MGERLACVIIIIVIVIIIGFGARTGIPSRDPDVARAFLPVIPPQRGGRL